MGLGAVEGRVGEMEAVKGVGEHVVVGDDGVVVVVVEIFFHFFIQSDICWDIRS